MKFVEKLPTYASKQARAVEIEDEVATLKTRPGVWALVRDDAPYRASGDPYQRRGAETKTVRNDKGTYDLYARWPK